MSVYDLELADPADSEEDPQQISGIRISRLSNPKTFNILRDNIILNKLENIIIVKYINKGDVHINNSTYFFDNV